MKFFHILLLFAASVLFSCKSEAEKTAERNAVVDSTITAFEKNLVKAQIDSVFAKNKFNGSVAVFQDGNIIYRKQNGFENFKDKTKIDSNTVFAIGSLSKQFTAAKILELEDAGKLSTKNFVSEYLPEFRRENFDKITIAQLLSHTSGLNDFGNNLLSKPGKEFNYSNKGYRFLGKIIEKVTGKSYDKNALELFKKAGMRHSGTANIFDGKDFGGANLGSETQNSIVENMPKRLASDDISVAAGGILSTIPDLDRWNRALFGGKILKPQSLQKMTAKVSNRPHYILGTVGYGYGIMSNLTPPQAYFHTGYVKGSPSLNVFYPETKTSVIILSNIANEGLGKEEFFRPHAEVKNATDAVEIAVEAVRREMVKAAKE